MSPSATEMQKSVMKTRTWRSCKLRAGRMGRVLLKRQNWFIQKTTGLNIKVGTDCLLRRKNSWCIKRGCPFQWLLGAKCQCSHRGCPRTRERPGTLASEPKVGSSGGIGTLDPSASLGTLPEGLAHPKALAGDSIAFGCWVYAEAVSPFGGDSSSNGKSGSRVRKEGPLLVAVDSTGNTGNSWPGKLKAFGSDKPARQSWALRTSFHVPMACN